MWSKTQNTVEGGGQAAAGTAVKLDISFQYRLRANELPELYKAVALAYRSFIENLATTTIRNISSSYTTTEWTENRTDIQKTMHKGIDAALNNAHADCGESAGLGLGSEMLALQWCCICSLYIHTRTHTHTHKHTYVIHTYIHTYIHTCMHACMHTYTRVILATGD